MGKEHLNFLNKINSYLLILLVFFIPIYRKIVPVLIILLFISSFTEFRLKSFKSTSSKMKLLFLLILYYAVIGLGFINTVDYKEALFDIEVKSSLILFPVIFFNLNFKTDSRIKKTAIAFISGTVASSLLCLGHAFYYYFKYSYNYFSYNSLSFLMHPSYVSLFILISIALLLKFFHEDFNGTLTRKHIWYFILILFQILMIFMLSSKAGILATFICMPVLLFIYVPVNKWKLLLIIALLGTSGLLILSQNSRFQSLLKGEKYMSTNSIESVVSRIEIYKSSLHIIKSNVFMGVGTGDVRNELLNSYQKKNMKYELEMKLNAHNQFLESFMAQGILGITSILLIFILPLILAAKNRKWLTFIFLVACGIHFLFESMLNTQAGVVFFSFFYCYFILIELTEPDYDKIFTPSN